MKSQPNPVPQDHHHPELARGGGGGGHPHQGGGPRPARLRRQPLHPRRPRGHAALDFILHIRIFNSRNPDFQLQKSGFPAPEMPASPVPSSPRQSYLPGLGSDLLQIVTFPHSYIAVISSIIVIISFSSIISATTVASLRVFGGEIFQAEASAPVCLTSHVTCHDTVPRDVTCRDIMFRDYFPRDMPCHGGQPTVTPIARYISAPLLPLSGVTDLVMPVTCHRPGDACHVSASDL